MTDEAQTTEPTAEAPAQSHAERAKKHAFHIYDVGHGVKVNVWSKTGSRGDYTELATERSFKVGDEWRKQSMNIQNSAVGDLIEKLQQGKAEFIDQQQQPQARAR